jgi:hypothetical protein
MEETMIAKRTLLTLIGVIVTLGLLVTACAPQATPPPPPPPTEQPTAEKVEAAPTPTEAPPATPTPDLYVTIYGERLPEDAAPYDMQVYKVACDIRGNHVTFDFQVAVYHSTFR